MPSKVRKRRKERAILREREKGFSLDTTSANLPVYDPLVDKNLQHFFENPSLQKQLMRAGMIDKAGNVIDYERNRSKLFIIEQEFIRAEKEELDRLREEVELKRQVQLKRFEALEEARMTEKRRRIRQDKQLTRKIIAASRGEMFLTKANTTNPSTLLTSGSTIALSPLSTPKHG
eukprot:TRINITY_DN349_c0_g1_i2.p1 TRINITY_DN349_c0_g1~~TRINITY_DN349_c0_g1_i2.p1  ORF type:complete len:175 (+),score=30.10 TRINITY_DN349_c0_g1_i2:38-562(+)